VTRRGLPGGFFFGMFDRYRFSFWNRLAGITA
jgi:hypothetical protein